MQLATICGIAAIVLLTNGQPAEADNKQYCLAHLVPAVDIGHHSAEPGARDVFGRAELFYNVDLAKHLLVSFSQLGFRRTVLINETLKVSDLRSRPRQALCAGADVFISIHHDNVDESKKIYRTIDGQDVGFNDEIGGYTIYLSSANSMPSLSGKLAQSVSESLIAAGIPSAKEHQSYIADARRRLVDQKLNIWDYTQLAVCRYSAIPAILIEAGFLSNRQDLGRLKDPAFQKSLAAAIAAATLAACVADPQMANVSARVRRERMRQCR